MDVVDAVIILLHPILGFSLAIWLYRQWKTMKVLKTKKGILWSKIQNKKRSEIVEEHEKSGKKSLLFICVVIFFAVVADTYRHFKLGAELSSLVSLHGWLGLILAVFIFMMYKSGSKIVKERSEGVSIKQTKGFHSRIGDFLVWLLKEIRP